MKPNQLDPPFRTLIGFLTGKEKGLTVESVLKDVSEKTGISEGDLKSKSCKREIADARKIYFVRSKLMTHATLEKIGELVNRGHDTVIAGIKALNNTKEIKEKYHELYG